MSIAEDVLDFLFDGAVPVEVIKMNDASEVHVNGPLKTKKKAWDEKTTAQKVGVATSYGGAAAGPAAIYMSLKSAREGKGGMPRDFLRSAGGKRGKRIASYLDNPKSRNAKVAAGLAGAGIVGLQSANWIGDAVNSRELTKTKSQQIDEKIGKMIHKAIMAGVSGEEVMEMIEKANAKVYQPAELIRGGQKLLGAGLAAGVAGTGYVAGRRRTNKSTEAVVDQRLQEQGLVQPVAPPPRQPLTFKPMPKTDYGTMPTVISSKYTPITIKEEKPKKEKAPVKKNDELTWEGEISKVDVDKQHVFGWCSIAKVNGEPVIDRQDDYIPVEEMERSAYDYVLHSRKGGDMHQRDGEHPMHKSDMIESFVVTPEKLEKMGIDPETVPHGWWVGFKVNDDQLWNEVKDGKKSYFSVHGRGRRVKEYI